jgi:hypothetical protein
MNLQQDYNTTRDHLRTISADIEVAKKDFKFSGQNNDDADIRDARYLVYLLEDRARAERTLARLSQLIILRFQNACTDALRTS